MHKKKNSPPPPPQKWSVTTFFVYPHSSFMIYFVFFSELSSKLEAGRYPMRKGSSLLFWHNISALIMCQEGRATHHYFRYLANNVIQCKNKERGRSLNHDSVFKMLLNPLTIILVTWMPFNFFSYRLTICSALCCLNNEHSAFTPHVCGLQC